ncbi:MFS transporter [Mucilaginibacter sabulilitoris]|uniref:MFS transporter n=1 Tax=Mucilaginibacter sabulilitoris TaxID=1173583 RepID=A0ABZ0TJ31_9SPHI|nr:MFS transporter [Mucilaginibacter sabulilitoris]WPU93191.1 MFS transporter [Mucilaginibacter sabulilitoris]
MKYIPESSSLKKLLSIPVVVAALGYFVDIYDLLLFSIVRVPSLKALYVPSTLLLEKGIFLINVQMAGMLLGGILWGVIGDKKGRLTVLFGSILLYSIANIANGFVANVDQYALLRFIAGIGLAGELGAGITLVAEILPKEIRGYGTSIVASVGVLGAVLAYLVADTFDWKIAYIIGGVLGLALLVLRFNVFESGMFSHVKEKKVSRGNFLSLFTSGTKLMKYVRCIMIGLPIWFVIGVLLTFSPEFGKVFGISVPVQAGKAVMFGYIGLSLGDLSSGLLSQHFKSRKKVVLIFLLLTSLFIALFLLQNSKDAIVFYGLCLFLGFSIGFWALFVTISAEQFGTNMRATVATTVPNFVRGSVNVITPLFLLGKGYWGITASAGAVGALTIILALLALWKMEETFHKDLNYLEI